MFCLAAPAMQQIIVSLAQTMLVRTKNYFSILIRFKLRTCIHNQRMPDGRGILLSCAVLGCAAGYQEAGGKYACKNLSQQICSPSQDAKKRHESGGGMLWTVEIRDDVRFSDGEKLTASDVAFTYNTVKAGSWTQKSATNQAASAAPHCTFMAPAILSSIVYSIRKNRRPVKPRPAI